MEVVVGVGVRVGAGVGVGVEVMTYVVVPMHVRRVVGSGCECAPTFLAAEGSLASVGAFVDAGCSLSCECFVAESAGEGPISCVTADMPLEEGRPVEFFATALTPVHSARSAWRLG